MAAVSSLGSTQQDPINLQSKKDCEGRIRQIDPKLLGESRYNKNDWLIVKVAKCVYYFFRALYYRKEANRLLEAYRQFPTSLEPSAEPSDPAQALFGSRLSLRDSQTLFSALFPGQIQSCTMNDDGVFSLTFNRAYQGRISEEGRVALRKEGWTGTDEKFQMNPDKTSFNVAQVVRGRVEEASSSTVVQFEDGALGGICAGVCKIEIRMLKVVKNFSIHFDVQSITLARDEQGENCPTITRLRPYLSNPLITRIAAALLEFLELSSFEQDANRRNVLPDQGYLANYFCRTPGSFLSWN